MKRVPDKIDFAKEEDRINEFWKRNDVFRNSLKKSATNKKFTFFDGPPFATGLPHYGHVLAGTIKDIVTRFAHQSGHYVSRRFGWDCHGLPVEYEIDKMLNITGPHDVEKMGIDKYNAECRKIVMRYSSEWEKIMGRLARWVDFEHDYKTLYPWYMESIWFIFRELYCKGLVYKGIKVMPYSTACNTPLSNFESGQNYKEVVDPQVIVGFPLDSDESVMLIAWTTTPWTLPSNLTLCVHPKLIYVKVKDIKRNETFIMMESRLCQLYKNVKEYKILDKFPGEKLKGLKYKPLFPYFAELKKSGAFQVLVDTYVTDDAGTGVVQQAPYFGEDDFRVCLAAGVVTRDQDPVCPVDASGRFMEPVSDFVNDYIKDADKKIIKYLKDKSPRRLVESGTVKHSYPFCWRSDTPLMYKAVPSWFIKVEQMAESLLNSSQETYWVPDFVKEKRFGNWLRSARDWAVSRNRYWGTPIPLWVSEDGREIICVGSIAELEELSGQKVKDLHRESIDQLTIPSARPGMPPLKRISEVFDCWFESGSMPYAQLHFPFDRNVEIDFHKHFPADFIAEGIDQTRGWFYTLLVISTALFNKAPFKNLIANGLVLASDGQKMSKRKKNYPDPVDIVNKYGADALRLYLINSPVVRAESLRFKEEGVRDVLKDVCLPWYNSYRYLAQSIERIVTVEDRSFKYDSNCEHVATNAMDKWIKSATQTMVTTVWKEMAKFHLYKVVPILVDYIDQLTNWYIRMNRKRLKGDTGVEDCLSALNTLFGVLFAFVRIMAPFTPYLSELMFDNLRHQLAETCEEHTSESVHYLNLPKPISSDIDVVIERRVKNMQHVINVGRILRDKRTVPVKYPLRELIVIHKDEQFLDDLKSVEGYILEELNIKNLVLSNDCDKYGVSLVAEVDHKLLGAKLKNDFKSVLQAVKELKDSDVQEFLRNGTYNVLGHELSVNEVFISYKFAEGSYDNDKYEVQASKEAALMFNMDRDASMLDEGLAREIVNRVQKLRKKGSLVPTDPISVFYKITPDDSELVSVATSQSVFIEGLLKVPLRPWTALPKNAEHVVEETFEMKGATANVQLLIVRGFVKDWILTGAQAKTESAKSKEVAPNGKKDSVSQKAQNKKELLPIKTQSKQVTPEPKAQIKSGKPANDATVANGLSCFTPSERFLILKVHKSVKCTKDKFNGRLVLLDSLKSGGLSVKQYALQVFGIVNTNVDLYVLKQGSAELLSDVVNVDSLSGAVVVVSSKGTQPERQADDYVVTSHTLPNQPFVNVFNGGKSATVLLVNDEGTSLNATEIKSAVGIKFGLNPNKISLNRTPNQPRNNLTVIIN